MSRPNRRTPFEKLRLDAELPLTLSRTSDGAGFGLSDDQMSGFDHFWLHVLVDGHDGWIHTGEDYDALGLLEAD